MSNQPAILLFRGNGFVSKLIQWQTRSVYSHAAILMRDGQIIEAMEGQGVVTRNVDDLDWSIIDAFDVPGADWDKAIEFAMSQKGKPYDYRAIARFVTRVPAYKNNKWFCSELVFESFIAANIALLERIEAHEVSPRLLSLAPGMYWTPISSLGLGELV